MWFSTIKYTINHREKLFSELSDDEKKYTKICFVRPVEERVYSGLNTILERNKNKTKIFLSYYNKSLLKQFIENSLDEHLTSYKILLENITDYYVYDLNVLKYKKNKSKLLDQ